ncbi:MAG: secondary thiamine-phosphate synthase enzyme YjbQ [bacterium]|nr:secondary thiamine-phosphate synthase enzyme YjbQ [bacterium]
MITKIEVHTPSQTALVDITHQVEEAVKKSKVADGVCYLFVPHTTAGITINENADPSVRADILMELNKLIPFDDNYRHTEGNSAAHIKSTLVGCSQVILIENGLLTLGTWQGIFFCEFDGPRHRQVWIRVIPSLPFKTQNLY